MPYVKTGNGASMTFGTSGFTPMLLSVDGLEEAYEALKTTTLATTGTHTYCATDLKELSPFNVTIRWENGDLPTLDGVPELITVTYPLETAGLDQAYLEGTGFVLSRIGPALSDGVLSEASFQVQYDGTTAPAYTDEV